MKKIDMNKILNAFEHLDPLRKKMIEFKTAQKEIDEEYMKFWRETTEFYGFYDEHGNKINFHIYHHPYRSPHYVVRNGCNVFDKELFECDSHEAALEWIFEQLGVEKDE